jgi:benzylsuccinate CoA-transferase BbsF subunit
MTEGNVLPLDGIRVADFCWVWAGPYCTMLLAALGAEVIKIEGQSRPDLIRRSTTKWRVRDDPSIIEATRIPGAGFNTINMSKKSLSLDLSTPESRELARRLAAISDVVVDNMRPGAMAALGLGYEDLRKLRPDIIVLSSSSQGQKGPQSRYEGFATIHQSIGGQAYITGYPDDSPSPGPNDTDIMNGTTSALAILAALYYRKQTGEGQFIDYSQCEGVSSLIGELLLGYQMNSEIPERMGNAHPVYAPHNLYRCWGVDRWLALEIHSDEEFAILAGVIGKPELASDPRFATMAARKKDEAELDRIIDEWTRCRDRDWMVDELYRAGLAVTPSQDYKDLYADPHLRARGAFVTFDAPEVGKLELVGVPWKNSAYEAFLRRAPLLGEHNEYVLKELLGLSQAEIDSFQEIADDKVK